MNRRRFLSLAGAAPSDLEPHSMITHRLALVMTFFIFATWALSVLVLWRLDTRKQPLERPTGEPDPELQTPLVDSAKEREFCP